MLERLEDPSAAAEWCRHIRQAGRRIGFVPTMGALHEGHLELVRRAAAENDAAVVSIFVNPLQFDDPADLAAYPRDFGADAELLAGAGCALVFTGTLEGFFPEARRGQVPREDPGPAARGLEGEERPGHFEGVATIVRRLFECVRPDVAYFGEKDFQQTLVVAEVARRLGFPEVRVLPTVREASGLARSSRNARLSPAERERAAALYAGLSAAREAWRAGERRRAELERILAQGLRARGIEPGYAAVRDPMDFCAGAELLERAQALVAARVGAVRLIDTLRLDGDPPATVPVAPGGESAR